jgi:3-dehydroquinate dehydratase/shikimate dehydrogenase
VFHDKERLGYNTDYMAAVSSIELAMGGRSTDETSVLSGKTALVLGAGGAGMALAHGLKKRGAMVTVSCINGDSAFALAKHLDVEVLDWKARNDFKTEIIANCTPIGMHPKVDESPIDKAALRAHMVVFDAVYNPENTLLIKSARQKACTVVTGVEMFVGQGCLQFKLFTGQKATPAFMRELLRDSISAAK